MEQLLFSNLINLPVAALNQQKKIGWLYQVLVALEEMEVIGFLVKRGIFFSPRYFSFAEAEAIEKEGIMIQDEEILSLPSEIVKVEKILSQKINLIGLAVQTKQKKYLGRVFDFVFDRLSGKIQKFYIVRFFDKRIISRSKIVTVEKRAIIVEDDVELAGVPETV